MTESTNDRTAKPSAAAAQLSPEASKLMQQIFDARGATLIAFAQVEWYLAKIILEAAKYDQYQGIDLSFTQDAEKRAQRVKSLLNVDGPFSPYADKLKKAIDDVLKHEGLRNFAAHGLLVRPEPNNTSLTSPIHLRMFRMYKDGKLTEETRTLTLKQYTDEQSALTSAAREFGSLVKKIWEDLKFKDLEAE